jgi:multidrug efflux pump subunit AcrB
MTANRSILSGVVRTFLEGHLAPLLIITSLLAGTAALWLTPREEEPQIVVPVADVIVSYPGGSSEEVERLVASRLEKLLFQIDGVEYVYSMSRPEQAVVTVRFFVGEDREDSLIKLYNKLFSHIDQVTPGIAGWVVKPVEIDDVPIITAALYSPHHTTHQLYRVAEEVLHDLQRIPDTARVSIHGGERRILHVRPDSARLAAHRLSADALIRAVQTANAQRQAGTLYHADQAIRVEAGPFLTGPDDVRRLVVGVTDGRPVYLADVADVTDGPAEITSLSSIGFGPGSEPGVQAALPADRTPAVTIAVAKKTGRNAVTVARAVEARLAELQGVVIPDDIHVRITRNYGSTANEKVNNLVLSLGLAIITVIGLLAVTMSWREGIIVAIAVPITYSLTLLFNHLMGFTINRVTLFALILTLGLLVDDPIVGVENINRHLRMKRLPRNQAILAAMDEVMSPIVLSTLAIMVSFFPMFFITGMMGPYMAPMAMNVPIAVVFSTVVALTVTPTLSRLLLKIPVDDPAGPPPGTDDVRATAMYRRYQRLIGPFLASRARARGMLAVVGLLFAGSVALALTGFVPLKMLPFDNKNELLVTIDLPETASLERTDAVAREVEALLRTVPEVVDFTTTVGTPSPMDFNGMVRQYYFRHGAHQADLRVNLLHHTRRAMDSHALTLRLRPDLVAIAARTGASIKLVETPPGPPVMATVVAEIYGSAHHRYEDLIAAAHTLRTRMADEPGVVDLDDSVATPQRKLVFRADRDKAGLHGIDTAHLVNTLTLALDGASAGSVHSPDDQREVPITVRWPEPERSDPARLGLLPVAAPDGALLPLGELGGFVETTTDPVIFHKNLERVVYVQAEMAGRGPAYAVLALQRYLRDNPLPPGLRVNWTGEGEWKITVDVFRDLGIAFAAALLGIYVLLVYETRSYAIPGVIMLSIPLTMIGIMPGFWLLNLIVDRPVGGFDNPVFFTATAMIGMIALAGIVVRNALVLIDFIRTAVERGEPLDDAIIASGAIRMRPILLTAGTTLLGAWPITLDPIFSGLAWSLIFGLFVSTAFTLVVVPVVYRMLYASAPATTPISPELP